MSPHPVPATPSTPRSGSPRSFQLSDVDSITEETTEETGGQAVQSSNVDDDLEQTPQLVMPSLTMPARRAFTERGRYMGTAKFMVIGQQRGVGSTSFINNVLRSSEHVVHFDHMTNQSSFNTAGSDNLSTSDEPDKQTRPDQRAPRRFTQYLASTRMSLTSKTQKQSDRIRTSHRKPSVSEGVLERNITFIDGPSLDDDAAVQTVLSHIIALLRRTAYMDSMTDGEIVSMLSGDGGCQTTAIIYLFEPALSESPLSGFSPAHQDLLQRISKYTNFIPLIGKADTVSEETLQLRKEQVLQLLELAKTTPYRLTGMTGSTEPLAISSLPGDDNDTIDASILMSSQYLAPLVASELGVLIDNLLQPEPLARLRYESSWKFLAWRQENLFEQHRLPQLLSPQLGYQTTDLASDASFPDNSSKALVRRPGSSFSRLGSPDLADNITSAMGTSALARYNAQAQPTEPFRQVRLAKWATDLQNSLQNQSRRHQNMYQKPQADWALNEDDRDHALVAAKSGCLAARGFLGGEVGVIDPRDPLGMLAFAQAFRKRGFFVVQLVGGCGLVGAAVYYVARDWPDVLEYFGFSSTGMVITTALPPPPSKDYGPLMRWLLDVKLFG